MLPFGRLFAAECHDDNTETSQQTSIKRRWRSIYLVYVIVLTQSAIISSINSSLWPYMKTLKHDMTIEVYGYSSAAHDFGKLVSSPIYGLWADKTLSCHLALIISKIILTISVLVYIGVGGLVENLAIWIIIVRFLMGCGTGNISLIKTYLIATTTLHERYSCMAYLSIAQTVGAILGYGLSAACTPLGYPGYYITMILKLNMYTMPGWLAVLSGLVDVSVLTFLFKECRVNDYEEYISPDTQSFESDTNYNLKKTNRLGTWSLIVINFIVATTPSFVNTLFSELLISYTELGKSEIIVSTSVLFISAHIVSIFTTVIFSKLSEQIEGRKLLLIVIFIILLGSLLLIPLHRQDATKASNILTEKSSNKLDKFRVMNMVFIVTSTMLITLIIPTYKAINSTMFSTMLRQNDQGLMNGCMASAGAMSKLVAPIYLSKIYMTAGITISAISLVSILTFGLILSIVFYKSFKPWHTVVEELVVP